jgi:hypothetical protein
MKLNTEKKKELAKKLNISLPTLYNWKKEKPYLFKLIELGLLKEKELEEGKETVTKEKINKIEETIEYLVNEIKKLKNLKD